MPIKKGEGKETLPSHPGTPSLYKSIIIHWHHSIFFPKTGFHIGIARAAVDSFGRIGIDGSG